MKVPADKVVNGLIQYVDEQVLNNLPTAGKWLVGTGVGIATTKVNDVVSMLNDNEIVKLMGIVDEQGMYDVDLIADNMKKAAQRYGNMSLRVPMVGMLTFTEEDVEALRNYIER